ncbi:MAG: hypothetical protein PHH93_03185 [Prolixibacteraceae bacterium]|nr:hypothetical protein [Prolixibacteraceae bacterium]
MKKLALILLIILSTLSCKVEDSVSFALANKSQYEMSEVKLYVNVGVTNLLLLDSIDMDIVQSGTTISKVFLESKLPESDGGFYLRFKQNNNIVGKEFGYFTNGGLLDKQYKITITDDEVTVSTK